jgi:hypothetical protein
MDGIQQKWPFVVLAFKFKAHANLFGNADRSKVSVVDQADQASQPQVIKGIIPDPLGGLCPQPQTPIRFGDHVRNFDFIASVDRPGQQPTTPDKLVVFFENGRPQA